MRFLVSRAFNSNNRDQIVGLPSWVDSERFDVNAKAPSTGPAAASLDQDALAPMVRALLAERFKMTYHMEERPVSVYTLVAAKPKMKKADPASRTFCKNPGSAAGAPAGTRILTCQNITMAQFADRLQNLSSELSWPVSDSTEIEGGWDFTLTFTPNNQIIYRGMHGGGDPGQPSAAIPAASEPAGGYSIFEAIEKELGLKLAVQKRPMPVIVIDHLEQKPIEN
jgi:uncharacterized protein (TIGR03435 family)